MGGFSMFSAVEMTDKDLSFLDKYDLRWAQSDSEVHEAFKILREGEDLQGLDIETTGLSLLANEIVGVTICPNTTISYYFPIAHLYESNVNLDVFLQEFRELCKLKKFVGHNLPFDWGFINYKWGIDFEIGGDSQVSAYICDQNRAESGRLGLKHLMGEIFNTPPLELTEDLGLTDFSLVQKDDALLYAAPDSIHSLMLYKHFKPEIEKKGLKFIEQVELNCLKPVATFRINGCALDSKILLSYKGAMEEVIESLAEKIYELAGERFDIESGQQLGHILYDKLNLPISQKNTNRSVDKENLKFIEKKHPIIPLIQQRRLLVTSYNNFVVKFADNLAEDGRLHANINSMGTRSGRFSASGGFGKGGVKIKVNLQQIPNKQTYDVTRTLHLSDDFYSKIDSTHQYTEDELKQLFKIENLDSINNSGSNELKYSAQLVIDVRSAFCPGEGKIYISCDYSQIGSAA